jgi:uncharacterized protein (TIGR03437 family)
MTLRFALAVCLAAVPAWCFDPAPTLAYSTYLRDGFTPAAVATDPSGDVYLAGTLIEDSSTGQQAALVVKLNPTGTQYIYSRVLGGSLNDKATAIAVDSAGNAYITGTANSPDFPMTAGRQLGTPPASPDAQGVPDARTFVAKLDPEGSMIFSEFLGGSVYNYGQAIALAAQGNILVSGTANSGFPVTEGTYHASGTQQRPYLLELDPTGATIQFSAFGIGGSALTTDVVGNVYVAGSTILRDYPTTPGVYQPVFQFVFFCFGLCQLEFQGTNQYVTKVDSSGTKLIYSTAVGGSSQTINQGLAVDNAGNAYLTGLTYGIYPYTDTPPQTPEIKPFLTKLDPAAQKLRYSVAIGGAGVAVDANGHVFVGGSYNNANLFAGLPIPSGLLPAPPPGVASLPQQCQENDVTTISQAYVSQVDPPTGDILSTVLVDGSNLGAADIALAGSTVWLSGATQEADVPITTGAVMPSTLKVGGFPGAFLSQIDFSLTSPAGMPTIACVLDNANNARTSPVARNQLLSLMGNNLGPSPGVAATDESTTSLSGVSVTFDGTPGELLYVSATQINVAIPLNVSGQNSTVMQVTVNSVSGPLRVLPLVNATPGLFANLTTTSVGCGGQMVAFDPAQFVPVAVASDGTPNSCDHPAKTGSVVSFFLDGLGAGEPVGGSVFTRFVGSDIPVLAQIGSWSAEVVAVTPANTFVWRVDVVVPVFPPGTTVTPMDVQFVINSEFGPYPVGPINVGESNATVQVPATTYIWVSP